MLQQICRHIAADEFRHFKLFYDHMRRYLARENIGLLRRLRIAAGRIGESEDDELAYAWHCGNEPDGLAYEHDRCTAAYMARAMAFYRFRHIERGMGMIFKAVGLPPRGRLSDLSGQGGLAADAVAAAALRRAPRRLTALQRVHEQPDNDRPRSRTARAPAADWPAPAGSSRPADASGR